MTWIYAWIAFATFGALVLYVGYGFVMSAKRANDARLSLPYVYCVDAFLSLPVVILDGLYNVLVLPVICLDFRPSYAFRTVQVKAFTLPFFELVTERLSRYNEDKTEWRYRRFIALHVAHFLDAKDPKGWHVRKASNDV